MAATPVTSVARCRTARAGAALPGARPAARPWTLAVAYFRAKSAVLAPATIQAHEESYRLRITTALGRLNAADIDRATWDATQRGCAPGAEARVIPADARVRAGEAWDRLADPTLEEPVVPVHLTPDELAGLFGVEPHVITNAALEVDVPVYNGHIDRVLFCEALIAADHHLADRARDVL